MFPLAVLRAAPVRAVGAGGFAVGVCVAGGAVAEHPLLFPTLGLWGKPHSSAARSSGTPPWLDCPLDLSHLHQHHPPALLIDTSRHLARALHTPC